MSGSRWWRLMQPGARRMLLLSFMFVSWITPLTVEAQPVPGLLPKQLLAPPVAKAPPGENAPRPGVGKLLRDLFGPKPNPGRERPTPAGEGAATDRDYLDGRAAHDPKVEALYRVATQATEQRDFKEAVPLWQRLLDLPEDSLVRLPDGRWQSARIAAMRQVGSLPAEIKDLYRKQYGGLARQRLNEANGEQRQERWLQVATRYFHTEAGYDAANAIAESYADRGEFGMAARWYLELMETPAKFVTTPRWRVKAAFACYQIGLTAAVDTLLEPIRDQSLEFGGRTQSIKDWFAAQQRMPIAEPEHCTNWTQLGGNASRTGWVSGSEPYLQERWSLPLTSISPLQQRLREQHQELLDSGKAPLPTGNVLAIGSRLLFRDLRGVRAVDLSTGNVLWDSIEGQSAERMLVGPPNAGQPNPSPLPMMPRRQPDGGVESVEHSPLANLIYRDSVAQNLSSDGTRLYFLEDQAILSQHTHGQNFGGHFGWEGNFQQNDPYGQTWSSNRLTAYDVESGHPQWTIGGVDSKEELHLPLAGLYFHGAPVVDGGDLFVVGSKGEEIRLWAIDPRFGSPKWSILVAYADTKIEQDIFRRYFLATPSVGQGVVVCPTTVGWLVGIDRRRQSVLWAHRYAPPTERREFEQGQRFAPYRELNHEWGPSAPIITGTIVVHAPAEEPVLVALDLFDGHRLWERPRQRAVQLIGVRQGRALVLGVDGLTAVSLETGEDAWQCPFPRDVHPTGRPALTEEMLFVPLSTGQVLAVDLQSGKVVYRTTREPNEPPLGNLIFHQGQMISCAATGVTAFSELAMIREEVAKQLADDPQNLAAVIRDAELLLLEGQVQSAVVRLRRVDELVQQGSAWPDALAERQYRQRRLAALAQIIHFLPQQRAAALAELKAFAVSPEELRAYRELVAVDQVGQGDWLGAFESLWSLAVPPTESPAAAAADVLPSVPKEGPAAEVTPFQQPTLTVNASAWLAGKLLDLWKQAPAAERPRLQTRIQAIANAAATGTPADRAQVVALLGFAADAIAPVWSDLDLRLDRQPDTSLETELLLLSSHTDRSVAAAAHWRLVHLSLKQQLPEDAGLWAHRLAERYGDIPLLSSLSATNAERRPARDLVAELQSQGAFRATAVDRHSLWPETELALTALGSANDTDHPVTLHPPQVMPYFRRRLLEYQPTEQRLKLRRPGDQLTEWEFPFRDYARPMPDNALPTLALGHQLFIVHQDTCYALSPLERRVVWTKPLDVVAEATDHFDSSVEPLALPLITVSSGPDGGPLTDAAQATKLRGRLAFARPLGVGVLSRRTLAVYDPITGQERWRRRNLPTVTRVLTTDQLVILVHASDQPPQAFRLLDGQRQPLAEEGRWLNRVLMSADRDVVLFEPSLGFQIPGLMRIARSTIRSFNPVTGESRWKLEFDPVAVTPLNEDEFLACQANGTVERIAAIDGRRTPMAPLARRQINVRAEMYALTDAERLYLVVNQLTTRNQPTTAENIPSIRADGQLFAWSLETGALLWQQPLANQHLIVDQFSTQPVVLAVSHGWANRNNNLHYNLLSITAIHKQTGKVLFQSANKPTTFNTFQQLQLHPGGRQLELRTFQTRLLLGPLASPAGLAPSE